MVTAKKQFAEYDWQYECSGGDKTNRDGRGSPLSSMKESTEICRIPGYITEGKTILAIVICYVIPVVIVVQVFIRKFIST